MYQGKKVKKYLLIGAVSSMLLLSCTYAYSNSTVDFLKDLYSVLVGKIDFDYPTDTNGGWDPRGSQTDWSKYENNADYIESSTISSTPYFNYFAATTWAEAHMKTCPDSSAFREMPIRNATDEYANIYTSRGNSKTIKRLRVTRNVPYNFIGKTHGGLTDLLSDSFYFWDFGNGVRRYNKKGDDNNAEYTYTGIGPYILSLIVYTEQWHLGIGFGVNGDGDFSISGSKIEEFLIRNGNLYLESCDVAEIVVMPNNTPNASISSYVSHSGQSYTSFNFSGNNSSDPDGNPLTYTWVINGATKTGRNVRYSLPTPGPGSARSYVVSLTVSDGDKSNTTHRTIYVDPYCYACNGTQIQ